MRINASSSWAEETPQDRSILMQSWFISWLYENTNIHLLVLKFCCVWSLLKETEGGCISDNVCNKINGQRPEEEKPGALESTQDHVNVDMVGDSLSFPFQWN